LVPLREPPAGPAAPLARQIIPPGTVLWRVHSAQIGAVAFVTGAAAGMDGRFDSPEGGYPAMYVSFHQATAVAERFLPGEAFTVDGRRVLPAAKLAGMVASPVETTVELILLRLMFEQDFVALRQSDEWLVTAAEHEYPLTRLWAAWLRAQEWTAQGIVWPSAQDMPRQTAVLFGDRCPPGALRAVPNASIGLDDTAGARWLARTLQHHRIRVPVPDPADQPLVFLNYRSSDDTTVVDLLDRELTERLGRRAVFRDYRSLRLGIPYPDQLLERVRQCKVLLVLIGRYWEELNGHRWLDDENDWVRRELVAALGEDGRVCVVPVLVGARKMVRAEDLPEEIRAVANLPALTLQAHYTERDVKELVDKLFGSVPSLADRHIT
jgi:RES domain-containing protein